MLHQLTRDQALQEIILAQHGERVPMLDGVDLSHTDLRKAEIGRAHV